MLVAEFTLTENPANTTTSQLRTVCHADDSVILGTWLQETDHRTIEDQVCVSLNVYFYFSTVVNWLFFIFFYYWKEFFLSQIVWIYLNETSFLRWSLIEGLMVNM